MMRKVYITLMALAVAVGLDAQTQDSLLRRQLELERDFNPTLLDANKIHTSCIAGTHGSKSQHQLFHLGRQGYAPGIALPKPGKS